MIAWEYGVRDYLEIQGKLNHKTQTKLICALKSLSIKTDEIRPASCFMLGDHLVIAGPFLDAKKILFFDPIKQQLRTLDQI